MKNILRITSMVVLVTFMSCNKKTEEQKAADASSETIEITDQLGTTKVVKNPKTVVVFDIGSLETLDQLGIKVAGVAKDNLPDYLSKYKNDSSIENVGTLKEPNYEKINALNPDLIIISARLQSAYPELSKIAPTVYMAVDNKDYMGSFEANATKLGQIFGKEADIKTAVEAIKNKIAEAQQNLVAKPEKALIVLHNNGKFSAYGKGSRFGFIHDVLPLEPAVKDIEVSTHGQKVSNEFIAEANPDILFIIDRNAAVTDKGADKKDIENVLIQKTNAYKNGKIVYLDPQVWYLSGGGLLSTNKMIDEIVTAVK